MKWMYILGIPVAFFFIVYGVIKMWHARSSKKGAGGREEMPSSPPLKVLPPTPIPVLPPEEHHRIPIPRPDSPQGHEIPPLDEAPTEPDDQVARRMAQLFDDENAPPVVVPENRRRREGG